MLGGPHTPTIVAELASTLPETEANVLMELPDTSQMRLWMQRKIDEYTNHASTLLAIYNSTAPIHILPIDILQEIFVQIPESTSIWCNAMWMLSLGSVCRHWRSILFATPEYWVRGLHTIMDPEFYECYSNDDDIAHGRKIFLARSAPCQLEITKAYSSVDFGPGWDVFDEHLDRVTIFEISTIEEYELLEILEMLTWPVMMKHLERLQLQAEGIKVSTKHLVQWDAEGLPRLGHLEISSHLFSRKTTVPSLHTVVLTKPPREIGSLPSLLDALENCPALVTLRLELAHKDDTFQNMILKRVLELPKLRNLSVCGGTSDVRCLLSALSFPSAALVELDVLDTSNNERDGGLVLPNVLPRRTSVVHAHQLLDGIDRLCFYSKHGVVSDDERAIVSMRGYVDGAERLRISPAFWLHSSDHFLRFLELFRGCEVTELVLDLRHATSDMDDEFWTKFFAALPDLLRLQLLSPTAESRAMKRAIAKHYLASCGVPHLVPVTDVVDFVCRIAPPRPSVSLAWVLPCVDRSDASQLDELGDVQQVLIGHTEDEDICLKRLELYLTITDADQSGEQPLDVREVTSDGMPSQKIGGLVIPGISGLVDAAEIVVIGSRRWRKFPENVVFSMDGIEREDADSEHMSEEIDDEALGSSSDSDEMQII